MIDNKEITIIFKSDAGLKIMIVFFNKLNLFFLTKQLLINILKSKISNLIKKANNTIIRICKHIYTIIS